MTLDFQYNKLGIQVTPQVFKPLKTQDRRKLGNSKEISNLGGCIDQQTKFSSLNSVMEK